jgi:hypothetical protein
MAVALVTITNISNQVIPILVNAISLTSANPASDISATTASQMAIPIGAKVTIETQRIDLGQLDQLRRKGLITYTS